MAVIDHTLNTYIHTVMVSAASTTVEVIVPTTTAMVPGKMAGFTYT